MRSAATAPAAAVWRRRGAARGALGSPWRGARGGAPRGARSRKAEEGRKATGCIAELMGGRAGGGVGGELCSLIALQDDRWRESAVRSARRRTANSDARCPAHFPWATTTRSSVSATVALLVARASVARNGNLGLNSITPGWVSLGGVQVRTTNARRCSR